MIERFALGFQINFYVGDNHRLWPDISSIVNIRVSEIARGGVLRKSRNSLPPSPTQTSHRGKNCDARNLELSCVFPCELSNRYILFGAKGTYETSTLFKRFAPGYLATQALGSCKGVTSP